MEKEIGQVFRLTTWFLHCSVLDDLILPACQPATVLVDLLRSYGAGQKRRQKGFPAHSFGNQLSSSPPHTINWVPFLLFPLKFRSIFQKRVPSNLRTSLQIQTRSMRKYKISKLFFWNTNSFKGFFAGKELLINKPWWLHSDSIMLAISLGEFQSQHAVRCCKRLQARMWLTTFPCLLILGS